MLGIGVTIHGSSPRGGRCQRPCIHFW
ncbi:MAG: hypothetical protein JWN70_2013, partial [Planctomycetaceae bacterium]|nr:hypothetical protein [Planctomycetaceae bacterium]